MPAATDIAFALAVLAVVGSNLPTALRAFLLTLAVVDDLIVIVIIAVFFTDSLHLLALAVAGSRSRPGRCCSIGGSRRRCSTSRSPCWRGGWSTSPASTPPSRASPWAC